MSGICVVYGLTGELAAKRGMSALNKVPGLARLDIDAHWSVAINPHKEEVDGLQPYHMLFEYDSWPAGVCAPSGGTMVVGRNDRAEDDLVKALEKALEA